VEAAEDAALLVSGDAHAGVGDGHDGRAVLGVRPQIHSASLGRELEGVVEQVAEYRLQPRALGGDRERGLRDDQAELDAGLLGPRGDAAGRLAGDRGHVDALASSRRSACGCGATVRAATNITRFGRGAASRRWLG
jgi:hypothetical protein